MTAISESVAPGRVAPIGELFGVVAIFAFFTCVSAYTQQITLIRFWDSDHYYWTTYYFATHHPVTAAAPYVYRIGLPWLVSFANPYRFGEVYREINVIAAGLSAGTPGRLAAGICSVVDHANVARGAVPRGVAWPGPFRPLLPDVRRSADVRVPGGGVDGDRLDAAR